MSAKKKKTAQIGRTPVSGWVRSKHRQWNFRWCEISGDVNKFRWTTYAKSPGAYVWKGKKWRWLWASPSENGAHAQLFGQASTLSFEAPTLWWNHYARKKKKKRNRTRFVMEKKSFSLTTKVADVVFLLIVLPASLGLCPYTVADLQLPRFFMRLCTGETRH